MSLTGAVVLAGWLLRYNRALLSLGEAVRQPGPFSSVVGVNVVPIYEYQCQSCHHELEALQKLSDAPLVDCPACAKPDLKKKISAAGFRLKGGGWYETDFKSGGKKNLAGESGNSPAAASTKTESSSDSKSTPKPAGDKASA